MGLFKVTFCDHWFYHELQQCQLVMSALRVSVYVCYQHGNIWFWSYILYQELPQMLLLSNLLGVNPVTAPQPCKTQSEHFTKC